MKKFLSLVLVLINLIIPLNTFANTSNSLELIDFNKTNNLIVNYSYQNYSFDDTKVNLYLIANIKNDFTYELTGDFKNYPISLKDIKESSDFNIVKDTVYSYIKADKIPQINTSLVLNNQVSFNNLPSGLYLLETTLVSKDNYTISSEPIILNLPSLDEFGYWNYETIVYPKTFILKPKYELVKYSVEKQWIDNKKNRPKSVEIEIYKDDNLFEKVILTSENNWTYNWEYLDDGSKFFPVERNIPTDYNVIMTENINKFVIINETKEEENNPQTYDSINFYLYLLITIFIGFMILTISYVMKRKNK